MVRAEFPNFENRANGRCHVGRVRGTRRQVIDDAESLSGTCLPPNTLDERLALRATPRNAVEATHSEDERTLGTRSYRKFARILRYSVHIERVRIRAFIVRRARIAIEDVVGANVRESRIRRFTDRR